MYKITLPESAKKRTCVINNRYQFVDGVLEVSDNARSVARILKRYYGCTVEHTPDVKDDLADDTSEGSLAKAETKAAPKEAGK